MNRVATLGLPAGFGIAGAILLAAALATTAADALAAVVLLVALLLAQVADPPVGGRARRSRAIGRIAAAVAVLALATVAAVSVAAAGFDLVAQWRVVAVTAGAASLCLLAPIALLSRAGLEAPLLRSERTALLRGAAVCAALGAGELIAGTVLPAAATALAAVFTLLAVLEGVAMARPGGAGLRRLPSADETAAVEAAVATGPPEVIGYRRAIVRSTGGAEYLSLDVLVRQRPAGDREREIAAQLEQTIRGALPDLVVSVRLRVGELPPPGPEDPTRLAEPTQTLVFDEQAPRSDDDRPTERIEDQPTEPFGGRVLPSAPWRER